MDGPEIDAQLTGVSYNLRLQGVDYMVVWHGSDDVMVYGRPAVSVGPITTIPFAEVREQYDNILKPRAARKALGIHLQRIKQ